MKKLSLAASLAFVSALSLGAVAFADDVVPGQYSQQDQSVMGVGQTVAQMGAGQRILTNAVNLASGAGQSRTSAVGVNIDYQFGQSQTDQSWKAARTVEQAQVRGLVPGDCQGDNSTDAYRKQMNQSREGYTHENLVTNAVCESDHATFGGAAGGGHH